MAEVGDLIDVWVVEARLGRGGTAEVYRCHNKHATRILAAVKMLDAAMSRYPGTKARFVREAEILFGLDHPNIVKVRNVRFDVALPYLEMEWVAGPSLETVLREGPLPHATALHRMYELMGAVTYLHAKGIRHRDIKPANIILSNNGNLVLVDFGLAVELAGERITGTDAMFGTVSYAPPEWVSPQELDPRAWDIYAAGIVFYEMLTGRVAFPVPRDAGARRQALQVMTAKSAVAHVDPGEEFPDSVRALIREMTAREPTARPQTAAEVLERLDQLGPVPSTGTPASLRREVRKPPGQTIVAPDSSHPDPPQDTDERYQEDTWNHALDMATPTAALAREPAGKETPTAALPRKPDGGTPTAAMPRSAGASRTPTGGSSGGSSRARGTLLGGAIITGAIGLAALLAIGGGLAWMASSNVGGPSARAVEVVVAGLPDAGLVGVGLDGRSPTRNEGFTFAFDEVPVGSVTVDWVVGRDCVAPDCPGEACPTWCATGSSEHEVVGGDGVFAVPLELDRPKKVRVILKAPQLADEVVVAYRVGERSLSGAGEVVADDLWPGPYEVVAEIGTCAAEDRGCVDRECPEGCRSWVGKVDLGLEDDEVEVEAALTALPASAAPAPGPAPRKPAAGAGAPVSAGAFAGWLGDHPEWERDAAMASGKADGNYLRKFDAGAAGSGSMTGVSWSAASAYCAGHGGLAALDAKPHAWTESGSQPFQEWRSEDGSPAWRRYDGATSTAARAAESNAFTGFRCKR